MAARSGWSVARLQGEINTAGRRSQEETITENKPSEEGKKTQNSTWVCAESGNLISHREAMVELRIQPESALDAPLKQNSKRGGAAKKKPNGKEPEAPRVLRFENTLMLLTWLAARLDPADLKAAGLMPLTEPTESLLPKLAEKQASRVIVWPGFKKPLTKDLLSGKDLTEELAGDSPAAEGND